MSEVLRLQSFAAYHPRGSGGGMAFKLESVPGRFKGERWHDAGAFAQLAEQVGPLKAGAGAPFGWEQSARFMLALRDIEALRYAYQVTRAGGTLPKELRPPKVLEGIETCSLLHKLGARTSVFQWSFDDRKGVQYVRINQGERKLAIQLSDFEGYQLDQWLSVAHRWVLEQAQPWRGRDRE
jgi:hypothetical protein